MYLFIFIPILINIEYKVHVYLIKLNKARVRGRFLVIILRVAVVRLFYTIGVLFLSDRLQKDITLCDKEYFKLHREEF